MKGLREASARPRPRKDIARRFIVDQRAREIILNGRRMTCSPMEFRLLLFFLRYPGIVFSRDELVRRTKGSDNPIDSRIIDVLVRRIRQKIERGKAPLSLRSIRGFGYIFVNDRDGFVDAITGKEFLAWPCCP
jgi:DNA-binding response OmpR family regulator